MSSTHDEIHSTDKGHVSHLEGVDDEKALALKLDRHGFALRPQPSDDPKDPLNWPLPLKIWVLFQVSFLAFLGPFTQAVVNSAFALVAKSFHISVTRASYVTNVAILGAGVTPLLLAPLANRYGRRPVFLAVTAIGVVAHGASGAAKSFNSVLAARFFVGVGTSAGMGVGAACVADLFFMHERGRYMGVFIVFVTNGAHVAAMIGGPVAQYLGWRWCFWLPTIVLGAAWVMLLFGLPETLYHRDNQRGISRQDPNGSWLKLFTFRTHGEGRRLTLREFSHVFIMLKYPSVLLPTLYYSVVFGLGSVLFAVTGAGTFGPIYHFDAVAIGLAIGLSTTIGTLIGEISAGPVSDRFVYLHAKAHNGEVKPESRLYATIPGALLLPIGVIIEGVCFQYKTHYMGPVIGIGIGAVGLQIVSTNIYAYVTDCYKPQSAEISTLLNFGRQTFSFTLGFYMLPFAHKTTYGVAWSVMAIIGLVLYTGIIALMFKGQQWRQRLAAPNFHRDI
ncbi:MFS general substrate transporter [Myriangium duriaei CBS 260.36]|uniref:MFS general substrate transporter n=1 Tax=Myriangium duriaei CBS 260.36 TaxID=1168546 RepID=A0A9P4J8T5_9PEZI|nr:MFS general substrate transporter [Myriangium duriaei CBS 260.36]